MNKFLNLLALVACLFTSACSDNNNEPEAVTPIQFEKTTIK